MDLRDVNFFEPFIKQQRVGIKKNMSVYIIIIIIGMVIGTSYVLVTQKINEIKDEISTKESMLNSEKSMKLEEEINLNQESLNALREYYNQVESARNGIMNRDIINSELIDEIYSTIPKEVGFTSFSITDNSFQMQCQSSKRDKVGTFIYNLKNLEFVKKVYTPSITESEVQGETMYSFSVSCEFKGDI